MSQRHNKGGATIRLKDFRRAAFRAGMSPTSVSYQAAEAVLVNGSRQIDAAVRYGTTRSSVCEAVARVREVLLGGGVCPMCLTPIAEHRAQQ
jgi:diketogulonate reductase-like aldo/keto reductase